MPSLKLAEAYVDIVVNHSQADTSLAGFISRLNALKGLGTVQLRLDRSAATASLNLFRQQLDALKKSAAVGVSGGGGGGRTASGGGPARSAGQVIGLSQLQANGLALQDRIADANVKAAAKAAKTAAAGARAQAKTAAADAKAQAKAAAIAAGGPDGLIGLGQLQASGLALQDRLAGAKVKAAAKSAAEQARAHQKSQAAALASARSTIAAADRAAAAQARAADRAAAAQIRGAARAAAAQDRAYQKAAAAADRAAAAQIRADNRIRAALAKAGEQGAAAQARSAARSAAARQQVMAGRAAAAGQGVTGLAQGLGIGGFAMSPAMMAGQMIGGTLKGAVGTAMELESTFVGIQRISGKSADEVERFKKQIFEISGKQAGVSVEDLTSIAMAGAKAGITDKEGLEGLARFTAGMAKVRNSVQGVGTEQLADDMTRMLNLFQKGTGYVESFGSMLAKMDNVSTSSAADILEISKSLSGTFTSLGMTMPQVMAFSSVLSDVGLTPQQGASSFSQIFRMIASQSEKMADLAGVSMEKFQETVRKGPMDALQLIIQKFKEINTADPIKGQEFLVSLGMRGVKTAGSLQQLATMFDQVKERTAMAVEEESSLGSLLSANALNSTTAQSAVQKLQNAFVELGDSIGKHLLKPLTEVAVAATDVAKATINMGGGEGKKPGLSAGERVELLTLNAARAAVPGGAEFPAAKRRREELNRKQEDAIADATGKQTEQPALTPAERRAALLRYYDANDPNAAREMRQHDQAMKDSAQPLVHQEPPAALGHGLDDMAGARARDRLQDAVIARENGQRFARPFPAPADQGFGAASEFARQFRDPHEKKEFDEQERDRKKDEKKKFQSQRFTDPADYARFFVQNLLDGKEDTPKQTLKEAEKQTEFLQQIRDKIVPDTPLTRKPQDNGPLIFRGQS